MLDSTDNTSKITAILQKLPVFAGLRPEEYDHIRKISMPSSIEDGEAIFVEDDDSPCMYVLLSGEVQLRTHNQGLIHTVQPGEVFGEIGFISQQKRTATAVASSTSVLLKINSDAFETLLGQQPRITFTIMRNITLSLADHIARMNKANTLDYLPPHLGF